MGFDYSIEYEKGSDNRDADALSRMPSCDMAAISIPTATRITRFQEEHRSYPYFRDLRNRMLAGNLDTSKYYEKNGRQSCIFSGNWVTMKASPHLQNPGFAPFFGCPEKRKENDGHSPLFWLFQRTQKKNMVFLKPSRCLLLGVLVWSFFFLKDGSF